MTPAPGTGSLKKSPERIATATRSAPSSMMRSSPTLSEHRLAKTLQPRLHDEEEHDPAAPRLVATLCDNNPIRIAEAVEAAEEALASRTRPWDALLRELSAP